MLILTTVEAYVISKIKFYLLNLKLINIIKYINNENIFNKTWRKFK